jgi:hypothetical protein
MIYFCQPFFDPVQQALADPDYEGIDIDIQKYTILDKGALFFFKEMHPKKITFNEGGILEALGNCLIQKENSFTELMSCPFILEALRISDGQV